MAGEDAESVLIKNATRKDTRVPLALCFSLRSKWWGLFDDALPGTKVPG